jgi:hypothetical protein
MGCIEMSTHAEFAVVLKMNPMFADLGAEELQRISRLCHTQQLAEGETLFQKGDSGEALYGVRRGLEKRNLANRKTSSTPNRIRCASSNQNPARLSRRR